MTKIHFPQLFLLLKMFGDELEGDVSSGYGFLPDTEEQGDERWFTFQAIYILAILCFNFPTILLSSKTIQKKDILR